MKVVIKCGNVCFNFMELFIRVSIFEVVTLFFSFSVAVPMYKIHDLDEGFSFLATVANDK